MRSIRRGVSVVVLGVLMLSLGVPLLAAQDASPVTVETPITDPAETPSTVPIETPSIVPPETSPVSSPTAEDGETSVQAQADTDPNITFSCAVNSANTATISYAVNANGNDLTSWSFSALSSNVRPQYGVSSSVAQPTGTVAYTGVLPAILTFQTQLYAPTRLDANVTTSCGDATLPDITLTCTTLGPNRAEIAYSVNANGNSLDSWSISTSSYYVNPRYIYTGEDLTGTFAYSDSTPGSALFGTSLQGPGYSISTEQRVDCGPPPPTPTPTIEVQQPTFTFSCTVTSRYTATISYEFNAHGNPVNFWIIRSAPTWDFTPSEVDSRDGAPPTGTLSQTGSYPEGVPITFPIQTGYSLGNAYTYGNSYVTCLNTPSTATVTATPSVTATTTTTAVATQTVSPSATGTSTVASPTATGTSPTTTTTATLSPTETGTVAPSTSTPSPTVTGTAVIPESGAVIVRAEMADGSDLPDGLQACVDADCQPLGTLASTQLMALSLPSGSGVAFFDVPLGLHEVTLRDAAGGVLDVREAVVFPDEATEVLFVLDRQPLPTTTATSVPPTAVPVTAVPTATSMAVSALPNTGQGTGGDPGSGLPAMLLGLSAVTLVSGIALNSRVRSHRRRRSRG